MSEEENEGRIDPVVKWFAGVIGALALTTAVTAAFMGDDEQASEHPVAAPTEQVIEIAPE